MRHTIGMTRTLLLGSICIGVWAATAQRASAHCDTMDGPVVRDAKLALGKGDVTPVLRWVKAGAPENEVRTAFTKTLAVRGKGPEARELADMYFFETLVRVHRAGEGAPYTGLKPAGTEVEPSIEIADKSLETGSADAVVAAITDAVAAGIRQRFTVAMERKRRADASVQAGREFVQAYVGYIHYIERLHLDAAGTGAHQEGATAPAEGEHRQEGVGHDTH